MLLGFPLEAAFNMSAAARASDLAAYGGNRTDPGGPAMTWGMFAIGYIELGPAKVSACARPRRTVSDLAAADGVAKLYGHVCRWWSWWCTVRGLGGLSIV